MQIRFGSGLPGGSIVRELRKHTTVSHAYHIRPRMGTSRTLNTCATLTAVVTSSDLEIGPISAFADLPGPVSSAQDAPHAVDNDLDAPEHAADEGSSQR